jgi:hypothetical protein|tara:strand:+ start:1606 stop:2052 length:447 start_codon:yes stop_codon:yes gene_type:complete
MATANLDISEKLDIIVKRGDSMNITLKFTESNGSATDLSSYTFAMSVKDKRVQGGRSAGINNPVIYEKTILSTNTADLDTGSQITTEILNQSPFNEVTFTVDATSMGGVDAGTYVYDIQYTNGSEVRTVLEGLFIVNPDVAFATGPAI